MSKTKAKQWNPRFRFYARTQGRTPKQQLEHDREEYPGGCMTGFICWLREQWGNYASTCQWVQCCGERVRETSEKGFAAYMKKTYPKIRIAW